MKGFFLGALVIGTTATALARPELNAFINKPANSVPELLAQIKSDKQVADRFMRHFSMTKEEVLEFVGTLHLGSLKESGYYTIYSAPENGIIKAHISFFKKGTPAFVGADGNPILRAKCANPFVRGPVKSYTTTTPEVEDITPKSNIDVVIAPVAEGPISASYTPEIPIVPESEVPITLKTTPTTSAPQTFAPSALTSILGLGGAASFLHRGSEKPAVPEPASMIALSVGAGALLRKRRKK